ncbi:MAG: hypothetical protein QOH70_2579 [Blastocatellia bacterium]|jgi:hypothetical protein|nr:hypothetical protein [Blastocatellia bacterium]
MENHRVKASVRPWALAFVSIGCSFAFSAPVAGQSGGESNDERMQVMDTRGIQLSGPVEYKGRPNDPKAMRAQVSEDFQRILTLHNEIVSAIGANRSLSYQFISDATGEIRKRSARLQSSLKLQKPEPTTANRQTETDLKVMQTKDELILLCKQIESFVRNPIIEKPGTIDAQQLERARKDLQSVVETSDAIRKQLDKQKPRL